LSQIGGIAKKTDKKDRADKNDDKKPDENDIRGSDSCCFHRCPPIVNSNRKAVSLDERNEHGNELPQNKHRSILSEMNGCRLVFEECGNMKELTGIIPPIIRFFYFHRPLPRPFD